MDLKELALLGRDQHRHWYLLSKSRALRCALDTRVPSRIIDVGAGSGFFARALLQDTDAQEALCVDAGYREQWSEVHAGKPLRFTQTAAVGSADLVLMMDVLEHVDDDVALVREYVRSAQPGTRFVVSVPAFRWLWSSHDVFLEHRRRYTLAGVQRVLVEAGLSSITGFYFFASVFPAAIAQRLWNRPGGTAAPRSQLRRHHPAVNSLLAGICRMECLVAAHNRWFGLTAFAVAEKK